MAGELRAPLVVVEPGSEGEPNLRDSLVTIDPLSEGSPDLQGSLVTLDPLTEGYRNLRITLLVIEALHPVAPEEYMSTTPFPGFGNSVSDPSIPAGADPFNTALPGLTFSVHKKPAFKTRIAEAAGGQEDRNALWEMPRWDFELTYDFLEDRSGADSSLKTIMGFFLSMQGSFDSWLFKDPDDYLVTLGTMGTTDGVTTQFEFRRPLGGFSEIVGQVDTVNTLNVYLTPDEPQTIPVTPGPYTITVDHAADYEADVGVTKGGLPLTKVTGAPAASQYAVNETTGVYTFNATDQGDAVVITYRYLVPPADYTITMPNLVVFDVAPEAGIVSWTGQFYFVCRFIEDAMDFEKFADKLWSLQTCEFRSLV